MEFKLGLVPSPIDERDFLLAAILPTLKVTLPSTYMDLASKQTPVQFQDGLGSCAAFAGIGQKEYWDTKELSATINLSEQWLYTEAKKIDGLPNVEGTHFRAILDSLRKVGVCEETFWPYEAKYPALNPPKAGATENAVKYKIASYASVKNDAESIKTALFLNGPILVGIKVYTSFYSTNQNGVVPPISGKFEGGHALLCVGWDEIGFWFKNSWSQYWGKDGYCHIAYDLWNQLRSGEAWSVIDVVGKKPWTDWLESDVDLGWAVKNSGVLKGYEDGSFRPYQNVTQHQCLTIAQRLGFPLPIMDEEFEQKTWITTATRGWIHETWPQYTFLEERWDEFLTRYQFAVIIGRHLQEHPLKTSWIRRII